MSKDYLWWRDGVIYQIYPRSFADSNDDGVGDLRGIIGKLDYLAKLGVDGIWLSPINPSPDKDFGYDVSNYKDIDPKYGTLADLDLLVSEAHTRGIHVIMDLVLNHSSDQHPWFVESRSFKDNPYRDWYIWHDPKNGKEPNNWQSIFGGKGWEFDAATGQYYYHMFVREQPDLNWRNPDTRRELLSVFNFWADRGVDGFRLDVFNEYFKDAQFRDNPVKLGRRPFDAQEHLYDTNQPEMMDVVHDIRAILDSYPERYAVGETFMSTMKTAADYCGDGKLHATFDFTFLWNKWHPGSFLNSIQKWESVMSADSWPTYVLNNHDNKRSATRFHAPQDDERLKVAAAMILTLRGTPFLYAGEEIGMRDIKLKRSEIQDPVGKHYWPINVGRDGCRSPMQWNAAANAGFSGGQPWLKVHPNYLTRNVTAQEQDPRSLLNFYRKLLELRRNTPALHRGSFLALNYDPRRVLGYLRQEGSQTVLVALNFGKRKVRLALGESLRHARWELLLSNKRDATPSVESGWLALAGDEACILLQK